MPRLFAAAALISIAATAAGCLGGDDSNKAGSDTGEPTQAVLTLANPGNPFDVDLFIQEVTSQSGGSVRIDAERNWREGEIDSEPRTIEDVRDGKVDMASIGVRAFDLAGVETMQPLVAPLQIDSYALEREVLGSPTAERMLEGVEQLDLVGIAFLPGELRKPLGISRGFVEAADYRGATIGIRPSEVGARAIGALGGTPESYAMGTGLSSFDGIEIGLEGVESNRYDGPARTVATNVNLWPRVVAVVMNKDAYASLSDDQREALSTAGRTALDPRLKLIEAREDEAMGILCNREQVAFRAASPAQLNALRATVDPVTHALEGDPATRDAQREIEAMQVEIEAEKAPACAPTESEQAASEATPLDGIWRMDSTADELAEIAHADEVVPENWGSQTVVMKTGRFAFTEENSQACVWGYGDYSVNGDRLDWSFDDGGGKAPSGASNRAGEQFAFGWSLYRDQLTLKPEPGAISPAPFRVNPWRRVEGDASLAALSPECQPPANALEPR